MTKVWRLLSILIIPLMCLGLLLVPAAQQALATLYPDWGYEILPNTTTVGFNTDFNVTVSAVCYAGNADTWNIMVDFDPTYLQVINITRPALLPTGDAPDPYPGEPTLNNTDGWVFDGYGVQPVWPPNSVNVTFNAWTIHFRSKNVTTGGTYLNFVTVNPLRSTMVILVGEDWLNWAHVVNGTVRIGSPTLTVNVTPAGNGTVKANGVTLTGYPNTTNRSWDDVVELNATTTVENWTFDHWSGDLNGSDNPKNITMNAVKNVMANFAAVGVGATLEGHVDLTGLPATNVTVRFFAPNTTTEYVAMKTHTSTDSNGNFTIGNLTPGTYDVAVKGQTSLSNLVTGVGLSVPGRTNFGVLLEGDASGDDYVDGSDFGPLSDAWLSYPGCPKGNWDATVDFSRDNYIDGSDFGPLSDDWLKWGDCFGWPGNWT